MPVGPTDVGTSRSFGPSNTAKAKLRDRTSDAMTHFRFGTLIRLSFSAPRYPRLGGPEKISCSSFSSIGNSKSRRTVGVPRVPLFGTRVLGLTLPHLHIHPHQSFSPAVIESPTTPRPIHRMLHQPADHRVHMHVDRFAVARELLNFSFFFRSLYTLKS